MKTYATAALIQVRWLFLINKKSWVKIFLVPCKQTKSCLQIMQQKLLKNNNAQAVADPKIPSKEVLSKKGVCDFLNFKVDTSNSNSKTS